MHPAISCDATGEGFIQRYQHENKMSHADIICRLLIAELEIRTIHIAYITGVWFYEQKITVPNFYCISIIKSLIERSSVLPIFECQFNFHVKQKVSLFSDQHCTVNF